MSAEHLDALIGKLDLAQKVRLLTGGAFWSTHAEPAIGLGEMALADGPSGVRGVVWDDGDPSVCLPSPTAIAASWDVDMATRMGGILAAEARRKGVHVVLAPTVNLHRSPLGGRHFECWSEDPLLTARMAAGVVRSLQDDGVAATVKHYVANDAETDRRHVDVRVDERTLREVYLAPFEYLVRDAGAWMVMAAYNSVNGATMTEHDLLTDPLRSAWGFDGAVVSDWRAARTTVAAGRAGLDLAMPGPDGPWGAALEDAVRSGEVDEAHVDAKVRNLLCLAVRVGALAPLGGDPFPRQPLASTVSADGAEVRAAARDGMVLVRNDGPLLPVDPAALRKVAVIGELAADPRIQGGGSAQVRPVYTVSILDGLRAALDGVAEVSHVDGCHLDDGLPDIPASRMDHSGDADGCGDAGDAGPVRLRWLRADGTLIHEERRTSARLTRWATDVPPGASAVEMSATFVPDRSGSWHVGFTGAGTFVFTVDGDVVLDGAVNPEHDDGALQMLGPPHWYTPMELVADRPAELFLRHRVGGLGVAIGLGVRPPRRSAEEELAAAAEAARTADLTVVVVGTSEQVESEGYDRRDLRLPGRQDELVRRVAAENPRTVVVVNSGSPVELPWRNDVPSILLGWFGGQEMGHAVADIVLGAAEPGGRLPTTWPDRLDDVPVSETTPVDGRLEYDEGLHIGYRAWLRSGSSPAYPFGHGLGYTSWELTELGVAPDIDADIDADADADAYDAAAVVTVGVRNTGERHGKQVVQVYLARPSSTVDRPVRWLAGFAVVRAEAGEMSTVEVTLPRRAFAHWDVEHHRWTVEPGRFDVLVGFSATDIHRTTAISLSTARADVRPRDK
ncbi:glycosyl hydrolase [Phytoactinopolyspora halotolerans]|uniref:Exo-alpha-(1->6)-L-arabinopyranosidase n=1 Tax=Phytoactinopolyspora halotolerans TaxID=1981512 RepID=A0A6L9SEZ9_9ACTN|nr:glycosyl hydrolase [Phytoactinopolyspora halotolerans]